MKRTNKIFCILGVSSALLLIFLIFLNFSFNENTNSDENYIKPIPEPTVQDNTNQDDNYIILPENIITIEECENFGGMIFNTLGETKYEGTIIGRIDELLCPCVCLVKN
ncbi:hypothetical protein KAS08_05475 [Candidatus Pacearchaeota archaeon]|nr:hypothetical protein [Candidatus Pacearchaeota archaeon]